MKATAVDLRCKTKAIFAALERRETISLHVRGELKGYIIPAGQRRATMKVEDHPFFGSRPDERDVVGTIVDRLRAPRCHSL